MWVGRKNLGFSEEELSSWREGRKDWMTEKKT